MYDGLKQKALIWLPDPVLQTLRARHYLRVLRTFDERTEPDLQAVRRIIAPGDIALDLGANIGVYTKVLAEAVGTAGEVIAVEPVPQTYAVLQSNVRALHLTNVHLVNAAASSAVGEVRMEVPKWERGGHNYYQAHILRGGESPGSRHVAVRATTVDILLGSKAPSFIKCDIEGHELACLAGAPRTLMEARATWLVEVWGDPDSASTAADVFNLFARYGYEARIWREGRLVSRRVGDLSTNYFFLPPQARARLCVRVPDLLG